MTDWLFWFWHFSNEKRVARSISQGCPSRVRGDSASGKWFSFTPNGPVGASLRSLSLEFTTFFSSPSFVAEVVLEDLLPCFRSLVMDLDAFFGFLAWRSRINPSFRMIYYHGPEPCAPRNSFANILQHSPSLSLFIQPSPSIKSFFLCLVYSKWNSQNPSITAKFSFGLPSTCSLLTSWPLKNAKERYI